MKLLCIFVAAFGLALAQDVPTDAYNAPAPVDTYGAPAPPPPPPPPAPVDTYGAPAPVDTYGAPAPVDTYGAPAPAPEVAPVPEQTYGAPAAPEVPVEPSPEYGAPAPAPAPTYGAPAPPPPPPPPQPEYQAPSETYGAPPATSGRYKRGTVYTLRPRLTYAPAHRRAVIVRHAPVVVAAQPAPAPVHAAPVAVAAPVNPAPAVGIQQTPAAQGFPNNFVFAPGFDSFELYDDNSFERDFRFFPRRHQQFQQFQAPQQRNVFH